MTDFCNSNANQATTQDSVLMYNIPFTLNDEAKETSDKALKLGFGINHVKSFEKFALQSSASINMTDYSKLDNLDSSSLSVSLGATWKQNQNTAISIPVIGNIIKYGHDDSYYSKSYGIVPQVKYQPKQNLSLSASLNISKKEYYDQPLKESTSWTFAPSTKYILNQSSWVNVGGYIGEENSKTNTSSNNSHGLNLSYNKEFSKKLNLNLSTSFNEISYDEELVAFGKSRDDKTTSINGNVSYFVDKIKSNISLNISHTSNDSNIDIYEYDRDTVGVSLSYRF